MLLTLFASICTAQGLQDERAKRADVILSKVRTVDLLNQILPILFTKEQLNKMLPVIEKARQNVRDQQRREFDQLAKLEGDLDKAIKEAQEKELLPGSDLIKRANAVFTALAITRKSIADENTTNVLAVVKSTLNPGQIKAMQNALDARSFPSSPEGTTMNEDQKLKLYVQNILLDPLSYDILLKIASSKSSH